MMAKTRVTTILTLLKLKLNNDLWIVSEVKGVQVIHRDSGSEVITENNRKEKMTNTEKDAKDYSNIQSHPDQKPHAC